ncbi:hypothetical protein Taro_029643 [Colocasia esculenta]|uniref:Uncharacterized protein n=1 Tax=Colocasia esculenta TaxID=4460 RepID=A0A843VXT3_COLES|nr:hypothetical protein [Colocasia esculenta]
MSHENWFATPATHSDKIHKYTSQPCSHGQRVHSSCRSTSTKTRTVETNHTTPVNNTAAGPSLTPLGAPAENPKVRH